MKRIILASLLLASPAMAQQQQRYTPVAQTLLNQALVCENTAAAEIGQLQAQNADLTKRVADLTKERDALKVPPSASDTGK